MFLEGDPRALQLGPYYPVYWAQNSGWLGLKADSVKIRREKKLLHQFSFYYKGFRKKIPIYLLQPDSLFLFNLSRPYLWVFPWWHLLLSPLLPQPDPFTPFNTFTPNLCCLVKGPHGLVIHYSYSLRWLQQGSIATSSNWAKNASIKNVNKHINQKLYKIGPIYKNCTWNFQHFVF